jgi:hypothetical protein
VKWGDEVRAEVFASRIAWAAGYLVEPTYFLKDGRIIGAKGLTRAKKYVTRDGTFTDARFELKEEGISRQTHKNSWRWDNNPFTGSKELNGLKVVVMLTSNWDPKDQRNSSSNTAIHIVKKTGEVRYVITDWGATMGKWGGFFGREKWDCEGYSGQSEKFISGVKGGLVQFGYDGKRASEMNQGIRTADVRWLMSYMGRVTDNQLRAALNASGATREEVSCFTGAIRERLNQLRSASSPGK